MKNNRKGFTIVELVIVIAVIGILAAVLIPTFGSVVENAQRSGALQEAKVAMEMVSMEENAQLKGKYYVICNEYVFEYDADGNGITNQKPENFTKKDTPDTQAALVTAAETTHFADVTPGTKKEIIHYVSKALTDAEVTALGVPADASVKKLDDFSTNVVVVGVGSEVETEATPEVPQGGDNN